MFLEIEHHLSLTYDALNRSLTKTNSANGHSVSWHFDENAAHSNAIGRMTSESDSADGNCPTTASWSYDPMGRLNWSVSWPRLANSRCRTSLLEESQRLPTRLWFASLELKLCSLALESSWLMA